MDDDDNDYDGVDGWVIQMGKFIFYDLDIDTGCWILRALSEISLASAIQALISFCSLITHHVSDVQMY